MYDKHPELQEQDFLWDMAETLRVQGFAWDQFFASQQFPQIACRGTCPVGTEIFTKSDEILIIEFGNTWGECWTSHQIISSRI